MNKAFYVFLTFVILFSLLPVDLQRVEARNLSAPNFKGMPEIITIDNDYTPGTKGNGGNPKTHDLVQVKRKHSNDPRDPLQISSEDYRLHRMYVYVDGDLVDKKNISKQEVLSLVESNKDSDNGYPMINLENMQAWIDKLGGNWRFISKEISVYQIKANNNPSNIMDVVSLSQLIELCGGMGGGRFGFEPYKKGYAKYIGFAKYTQTRVPTGSIGPLNLSYKVNDTVSITGQAEAFSAYNRRIIIDKFTIYNKSTGGSYKEIVPVGTTGASSWQSKPFSYKVTEPGLYEVNLYVKDYQWRNADHYPYTKTFVVGGVCDPTTSKTTAELHIKNKKELLPSNKTFQMPQGADSISLNFTKTGTLRINNTVYQTGKNISNIPITGVKQISFTSTDGTECWIQEVVPPKQEKPDCKSTQTFRVLLNGTKYEKDIQMPSGDSFTILDQADTLRIEAPIRGTYYLNNSPLSPTSSTWMEIGIAPYASFNITFTSDDGSECWQKEFNWKSDKIDCPTYSYDKGGNDQIMSGKTIEVPLHGDLDIYASHRFEDNPNTPVYLLWKIIKPDGSTYTINRYLDSDDRGGKDRYVWRNSPTNHLKLPTSQKYDKKQQVTFDQIGKYEIWTYNSDDDFADCPTWRITVEVKKPTCTDFTVEVEVNEKMVLLDNQALTLKPGKQYVRFSGYLFDEDNFRGDWILTRDRDKKTIITWDGTIFAHEFSDLTQESYTLTAIFKQDGLECKKEFKIYVGGFTCDDVTMEAYVNGDKVDIKRVNGKSKLEVELGRMNNIKVKSLYDHSDKDLLVSWTLSQSGHVVAEASGNPFIYSLINNEETTYLLELKALQNGRECLKVIEVVVKGKGCEDIYLHFYNKATNEYYHDMNKRTKKFRVSGLEEWTLMLTDNSSQAEQTMGTSIIQADWLSDLPNMAFNSKDKFIGQQTGVGTYVITAKVNDPRYPHLQGCSFTFTLVIDPNQTGDCSSYFIHLLQDEPIKFTYNVNHKKLTIVEGTKSFFLLNDNADDWKGLTQHVKWSISPEVFQPKEELGFLRLPMLKPGIYNIKGTINSRNDKFDNCTYEVTIEVIKAGLPDCPSCQPGGEVDGGTLLLKLYDSSNRLLQGKRDGVWEKEPMRIDVEINQAAINQAFLKIDGEIEKAVRERTAQIESMLRIRGYVDIIVNAVPSPFQSRSSPITVWPPLIGMKVEGPGQPNSYQIDPQKELLSFSYAGAMIPTRTTWGDILQALQYDVRADGFEIKAPYTIKLDVSYKICDEPTEKEDEEGNPIGKKCVEEQEQYEIANRYSIKVKGTQQEFHVFEPNGKGIIEHTEEWKEYHARDRYPDSKRNDFYAGERILTRVILEDRHKHPVSKKLPLVVSANAWISERGKRNDLLQSQLRLRQISPALWKGTEQTIDKLGKRELGIDIPLMGDKQKGFEKGKSYAVQFQIEFSFGVKKGFSYPQKSNSLRHHIDEYRAIFTIIANAWERQGIRNHITK
ncbi:hypothetical protein EEL30_04450 [Brevibacillus laterosporus]|uniref:Uncharacterized protein n=1 Tax=Brevibacillus laterosporus TaxID=1465 RepID=A0A518V3W4_BRELA|nr:hypothetical protein EEL30_04450 [Brevibacillus laterosporus]